MWRVQRFPNGGNFQYDSHGNQTEAIYSDSARNRTIDYSAADQAVQIRMGNAFAPSLRTRFWYGPDGSRYQREDNTPGTSTKRTLYIGNLEIVSQGGITTTKRYVAGVLVQDLTSSGTTSQFLFHDHLGSVVRAVSASGVVLEGMDYGAFGERRGYTDPTLAALVPRTTARGLRSNGSGLVLTHLPLWLSIAKCPVRCESSSMVPSIAKRGVRSWKRVEARSAGSGLVLTDMPWCLSIAKCPARCESSSMVPSIT